MTAEAQDAFKKLRQWIADHCNAGHPVRQSHYHFSLSAPVHRLVKFGPDDTWNEMDCRDLLSTLMYVNGKNAEFIMRAAFTRAIIDGDLEVIDLFMGTKFIPECRDWYGKLCGGIMGATDDAKALTEWLENLPAEEKSIARLMVVRVFPDTAHITWLDEVPGDQPRLASKLATELIKKPIYKNAVEQWLRTHTAARNEALV